MHRGVPPAVAAALDKLQAHVIHKSVVFNPLLRRFVVFHRQGDDGRQIGLQYCGIHSLIHEVFCPTFDFSKVQLPRRVARTPPVTDRAAYVHWLRSMPPATGAEGGILFANTVEASFRIKQDAADDELASANVLFRQFRDFLVREGFALVGCEFAVHDPLLGYATRVDAILELGGQVYFAELKTGYANGAFLRGVGRMEYVARKMFPDDSPRSQALLQAVLPVLTVARFADVDAVPLVLHVQPDRVDAHVPEWTMRADSRRQLHAMFLCSVAEKAAADVAWVPPAVRYATGAGPPKTATGAAKSRGGTMAKRRRQ